MLSWTEIIAKNLIRDDKNDILLLEKTPGPISSNFVTRTQVECQRQSVIDT